MKIIEISLHHLKRAVPAAWLLIFTLLSASLSAQDDCALKLVEAQALFDRGQVERVEATLSGCLVSGRFSREEELQAYKLIIQSLLLDEKFERAEETMISFLKRFPEYEVTAADYPGFVYLKSRFRVKPMLMLSVHAGLNQSVVYSRTINSVSSQTPDIKYRNEPFSLLAGTEVRIPLNNRLQLTAGAFYSGISFRYEENILGFGTLSYRERQSRVELPVTVVVAAGSLRGVTLYGRAGAGVAVNLSSEATAAFTPSDLNNFFSRTGEDLNRNDSRIGADIFLQGGAGAGIKVPRGYISGEIRLVAGLINQARETQPGTLEYFYFHTDDRFRIGVAGFTIGYTYIFYKPVKTGGQ